MDTKPILEEMKANGVEADSTTTAHLLIAATKRDTKVTPPPTQNTPLLSTTVIVSDLLFCLFFINTVELITAAPCGRNTF